MISPNRRAAVFEINVSELAWLLMLPEGFRTTKVVHSDKSDLMYVVIENDLLPETPEGVMLPKISLGYVAATFAGKAYYNLSSMKVGDVEFVQ